MLIDREEKVISVKLSSKFSFEGVLIWFRRNGES